MKGFLIDTCVISELAKKNPSSSITSWFGNTADDLYLSVITVEEFLTGLHTLGSERKLEFFSDLMSDEYEVLPVTVKTAEVSAKLRSSARRQGITMSIADALIAAAALERDLTLVTRNVKDFKTCGVTILDPFSL